MSLTKDYPNTNWATATETTVVPRISYPFKDLGDTSGIIYERDYVQAREDFSPMALDTADGTYSSAYLIEETQPSDAGCSLVAFTRRFATIPSSFSVYRWETVTFLGYYANQTAGGSAYRPQLEKFAPITETRTFAKSASGTFTITGTPYKVEKSSVDATEIQYLNASSSPTISAYSTLVSGSTPIQLSENVITRAYGVGNIWMQIQSKTPAQ